MLTEYLKEKELEGEFLTSKVKTSVVLAKFYDTFNSLKTVIVQAFWTINLCIALGAQINLVNDKVNDKTITELGHCKISASGPCLQHKKIIDLLATEKSRSLV